MNTISKFGLAAVLALGVSGAAMAQDADVGLDAGADVEIGADTGLGDVNTDLGVDAMATGSIANQDSLATSVSTASSFDLSGYSDSTNVNCVAVSTLEGGAQGSAQTIGDAAMGNSAIMNIEPIFALVLAWAILGQTIAPVQVAGGLVVVATVMWLGLRKG